MPTVRCLECDNKRFLRGTKLKPVNAWGFETYYFRCKKCETPLRVEIKSGKLIEVRRIQEYVERDPTLRPHLSIYRRR